MSKPKKIVTDIELLALLDEKQASLQRAILQIRCTQGKRSLPVVLLASIGILAALWGAAERDNLIIWLALECTFVIFAFGVLKRIASKIEQASNQLLIRYRIQTSIISIVNAVIVGAVFWIVGIDASQEIQLVITLIVCLYCIGTLANISVDPYSFPASITIMLGQGIVYFLFVAEMAGSAIAISISAAGVLLLGFGRINAKQFSDSIAMRTENNLLIKQLEIEKKIAESALEQAEEANIAKSRFLAAASHDLRQPLHALGLFLGSLSLVVDGDEAKKLLKMVRTSADTLGEHFNSLLDLSRFDVAGMEADKRDFDIAKVLSNIAEELRPAVEDKGLGLTLNIESCRIYSDPLLIERLVRNLLTNALRYTPKGSISILTDRTEHHIRVAVVDTGLGISQEKQSEVFEEFVQLNNVGRQREQGVGLGLAIVKRINELLDLNLHLQSQPGLGTRFEFELPIVRWVNNKKDSPAAPEPEEQVLNMNGCYVWVIENDALVAEAISSQLIKWNCQVFVANSKAALQKEYLQSKCWPKIVLIDDMLSEQETGLDIANWLRSYIALENLIFVTGNTDPTRLEQLSEEGFEVILKPASPRKLSILLAKHID